MSSTTITTLHGSTTEACYHDSLLQRRLLAATMKLDANYKLCSSAATTAAQLKALLPSRPKIPGTTASAVRRLQNITQGWIDSPSTNSVGEIFATHRDMARTSKSIATTEATVTATRILRSHVFGPPQDPDPRPARHDRRQDRGRCHQ